jgi:hypothetical protein
MANILTMRRDYWLRQTEGLDPATDYREISRILVQHEFPWDMTMALSFALFRTYAVPGIGRLLNQTGEFENHVQKRYDDTALLLEAPLQHGFDSEQGRTALRRINGMHRAYDIPNHEMLYVLSTFVVVPNRWMSDYGKRGFTAKEQAAGVTYYRELGRRMGIKNIPGTYEEFEHLMDSYEAEHFAYDPANRKVADSTLALMATFYPAPRLVMNAFARSLMDEPLLRAFEYKRAPWVMRVLGPWSLRMRGRVLRFFPARKNPKRVEDFAWVRSYPLGHVLERLGTFPERPAVTTK